jgi:hypothetical protein
MFKQTKQIAEPVKKAETKAFKTVKKETKKEKPAPEIKKQEIISEDKNPSPNTALDTWGFKKVYVGKPAKKEKKEQQKRPAFKNKFPNKKTFKKHKRK